MTGQRSGGDPASSADPTGDGERPLPTSMVLVGYALAVVFASIAAGVADWFALGDTMPAIVGGQFGFWAALLAVVAFARSRPGAPAYVRSLRDELRPADALGVVLGVATQLVVLPALYFPFRSLFDADDLSGPAEELFADFHGVGLVLMGIGVVVIAPVVEELFFRSLLLSSIRHRWGTAVGVVASSAFFAATHFQPLQFLGLFAAGLMFAGAVVRTGRLGTAIAVHAGFNATTFIALVVI